MLYNRCTGIYKFGNNTYPRRIRRRSNLGHIFLEKKCVVWAGKYSNLQYFSLNIYISRKNRNLHECYCAIGKDLFVYNNLKQL